MKKFLLLIMIYGIITSNQSTVLADPINLSLEDSIILAFQHNPTIKAAQADQTSATWQVKKAESHKMFNITYNHTDIHEKTPPSLDNYLMTSKWSVQDTESNNTLTLNWQLYTGGKVEGTIKQSKINLGIA